MRALIVLASLTLTACATEANYRKVLDSWLGQSEQSLIGKWGPPQGFYETGGTRYLTYSERRDVFIPGTAPSYQTSFVGSYAYTRPVGGTSPMLLNRNCQTTFTVSNGYIASYQYQGNNCVAKDPD